MGKHWTTWQGEDKKGSGRFGQDRFYDKREATAITYLKFVPY